MPLVIADHLLEPNARDSLAKSDPDKKAAGEETRTPSDISPHTISVSTLLSRN